MNHKYNFTFCLAIVVLMLGLVALASQTPSAAYAGAGLPSRDAPTPLPHDDDKDRDGPPVGAYLELVAPGAPFGAWAVVQWQDSAGGWHDVEGWRGTLSDSSRWWVHPKDFGTGPFRWVVSGGPGGAELESSEPFNLPGQPNQTMQQTILLTR
ncbi:MAG: hypothetical protein HC875_34575 [Anaerolineales bacterium]|nr:hypothetical protein [Anaerolineales bacterium]